MENMAKIKIFREKVYADSLREYIIMIDGKESGWIEKGQTKTLEITPGRHEIYLKIDFCRSKKINFNITEGNEAAFWCQGPSGLALLFIFFYALIFFSRYIKLVKES